MKKKESFFKQKDKQKHMLISFIIAVVVIGIAMYRGSPSDTITVLITATFVMVSIFKEIIFDKILGKGTPDAMDVVANFIGMAIALILYFLYINKILF